MTLPLHSYPTMSTAQIDHVAPPAAPWVHRYGMLLAFVLQTIGVIASIVLAWRYGGIDALSFWLMAAGVVLTGLGITIGYHRLLTHRSFETYRPLHLMWMMLGALAMQKSPLEWCATHRKHHAISDKPDDPHSPHLHGEGFWNGLRGFFYAHMGWLITGHIIYTDQSKYVPDLIADPVAVWIHRTWEFLWVPLSLAIPTAIAGLITGTWQGAFMGFLWGGIMRTFIVQHITFSTNSLCHLFGKQHFQTDDESRNNPVCGIISAGEGWHNNHHAFPTSARHGLLWWQLDFSWIVIRLMERLGLVWNVQLPSPQALARKRIA